MKILAHRGLWKESNEKNTLQAFLKAFNKGFGIETDLRDYCGRLVVSHNVADEYSLSAEILFDEYKKMGLDLFLALNIKADGIQDLIIEMLKKYGITNYALFDSSVPEMVVNKQKKLKFFSRKSDIETNAVLFEDSVGVWLDSFYDDSWLTLDKISFILEAGKYAAIVSNDLHGKDNKRLWTMLKTSPIFLNNHLILCTDKPERARSFFIHEN